VARRGRDPLTSPVARAPGVAGRLLGPAFVLPFAIFWSTLDRSIVLPLVPVIAEDHGSTIVAAGMAVTVHALAYSALQLMWGPLSTRWGRVKVLTVSTAIAAVANLLSAVAPSMTTFILARTASGGAFAATFAAVLTYFGDTLPLARRPAAMSNLATAAALGLAAGTLGAGAAAQWVSWRWIFAAYAVVTGVLVLVLARLPDPGNHADEHIGAQLRSLARNRWALALFAITALEGFLLIGIFNFLPAALQLTGESVFVSGLVTASFGVAVVVVSQVMKLFVARVPAWGLLLVAGLVAVAAFVALLQRITPITVLVGAGLMGVAWALGHTTLQTWMTDAAHDSRALGMTFFSISLMLGGAVGAAAGSFAAGHAGFGVLFGVGVAGAAAFTLTASWGRARYRNREVEEISIR